MKTNPIFATAVLAAGLFASGALAQPASPAPAPQNAPPPPPAEAVSPNRPTPDRTIYVPRLPSATELTNVASAQGLSIEQINETASEVIVVYKNSNGQPNAVAYELLLTAGTPSGATAVVTTTPPPAVVYYTPAPRAYYYDYYDPFYAPWPWYGPVAFGVGVGLGFHGHYGHYGHYGYHGGFHHR